MNSALLKTSMVPRLNSRWQKVCDLRNVAQSSPHPFESAGTKKKSVRSTIPAYALLDSPDFVLQSGMAAPGHSVQAMLYRAEAQEKLISDAEIALASQTPRTFRKWYSHWRCRGVLVNDLLDLTWVWCQRSGQGR